LRLWDDLVAHSFHANGIMIIIDNADGLFSRTVVGRNISETVEHSIGRLDKKKQTVPSRIPDAVRPRRIPHLQ
jgi:hypothetical protein